MGMLPGWLRGVVRGIGPPSGIFNKMRSKSRITIENLGIYDALIQFFRRFGNASDF
jgi:hypothetical protein